MKSFNRFILVFVFLAGSAYGKSICEFSQIKKKNTILKFGNLDSGKKCFIFVQHSNNATQSYRSHYFDTDGKYMVFNSYGSLGSGKGTGAREFLILNSRPELLSYTIGQTQLSINLGKKMKVFFDLDTSHISTSDGIDLLEQIEISPNNGGGVDVISSDIPFIDFGFKKGGSPSWVLSRDFTYEDRYLSKKCSGKNSDIFSKINGNLRKKYVDNSSLIKEMRAKCSE